MNKCQCDTLECSCDKSVIAEHIKNTRDHEWEETLKEIEKEYNMKPEEKVYVFKMPEKATRYNEGKLEWSLIDYPSLEPLVRVLMFGKEKYDRDNWKKGFNKNELLDSLLRHTLALSSGEETDPEHGLSHVSGIMFNAMAYEYCTKNNKFIE